jgi:hypothetical protein
MSGHFHLFRDAASVNNDVDMIFEFLSILQVLDDEHPLTRFISPRDLDYLVPQLDLLFDKVVLFRDHLNVVPYFGRMRIWIAKLVLLKSRTVWARRD